MSTDHQGGALIVRDMTEEEAEEEAIPGVEQEDLITPDITREPLLMPWSWDSEQLRSGSKLTDQPVEIGQDFVISPEEGIREIEGISDHQGPEEVSPEGEQSAEPGQM